MRKTGQKKEQEFKGLRSRAENYLRSRSVDHERSPDEDVETLIQELRVHQIELEMQNEELRNAQAELAESRDRYFDLYDLAPVGYFTLVKNGLILEVNLAGADLLGSDRADLIKQRFSKFVSSGSQNAFYSHWKQALKTESKQVYELELKRKNGQTFYAQLQSVAVQDNEGNATRLRTAVVDITARKGAEVALLEAHDQLERKIVERTAALSKINAEVEMEVKERRRMEKALLESENELHLLTARLLTIQEDERKRVGLDLHDTIAQNLIAIRMFVETKLKTMTGSPPPGVSLERIYSMIGDCIVELRRILDNLRPAILDDLGVIVAINRFCEEFQEMNQEINLEKEITAMEEHIPERSKISVYRILQEALNNVSKHSQARSVKVFLRKKMGGVELGIKDDGVGFDAGEIASSRLKKGIGLSSIKERAYLSGGVASIQSQKSKGTTVIVLWDCSQLMAGGGDTVKKKSVLIVDDHPLVREGLKVIIGRSSKFEVVGETGTVAEGLLTAEKLKPDLVLLDISLPDGSGLDLTKRIRAALPNVGILIVSMHSKIDYITEAFRAGASGYMVKESAPEGLLVALESIAKGEYYLDTPLSHPLIEKLVKLPEKDAAFTDGGYRSLTPREQEIMRMLAKGISVKEIAGKLFISPKTVENHRTNIKEKLGLQSTIELARYAARLGLIDVDEWKN